MEDRNGATPTVWTAAADMPATSPLREDTVADVCIIGAGISGLTTAYLLAREGKSVVVLEDGAIGSGMSGRTTAHLASAIDDRYVEIERVHGKEGARLAAESQVAAIDQIGRIVAEEAISCDFEHLDGYLFLSPDEPAELLDRELEAAHRAGLTGVVKVERAPLAFETGPCLRFPHQAQFHPMAYMAGLASGIVRLGGRLFTGSHVTDMHGGSATRAGTADGFTVTAGALVVATNTPINDLVTMHTKQAPYTTYVLVARIPAGAVAKALYWDTADPYHYVRLQSMPCYDLLIVGGEDHKTGQAEDGPARHDRLEAWARARFPMITEVETRWSGQVMEPVDGVAFIGHNPADDPHVYLVTGDSGMGMTHGTIAGMLLTDLILERPNPWAELYDPARKSLLSLGTYLKENLNVAAQYLLKSAADDTSLAELQAEEGAIIREGGRKMAVYRDPEGSLVKRSAVCPHLGCTVRWNRVEKTWDCPCHGSRFDRDGQVINGPANVGLEPIV